ncbi:mannose-P-dolichol utilization defect 1 protein [Gloeophyllum trabeum ATCC 11539]|uniref:Mannose-P-dolichol utilization defect 1 protein homolog n=1 Tax=Gloeophyllum trabeum (strain ATCC 11539 / FP-39264 / Madison 617) TaxID=670483 RepID=S7PUY8_GLOTA|nr:mannose-P-dolichol utilization defect 1 protein [Gloeophyllum trabeum ATCC 11539]EPQ51137.1 mannose-P-dolichol utilization defect 1 protein [Gloeophyllum trabeum ATCC 11539]
MTSITRNLPWFVRDLGVAIVGKKCYISLVENLNVSDVECIKYSVSKGLGIGIVVGGSIMKVPQLLLILSARSARGLSLPAYVLETLAYAITLAYSFRNAFPFSTYGENLFLTAQNVLITLLIIYYAPARPNQSKPLQLTVASLASALTGVALYTLPTDILALLQLSTLPLSLFSKLPQIMQNYRAQSTGQLSAFAVLSQIVGCLARLFTTATEVGDPLVIAGFALALLLNGVLGAQLWIYWDKDIREKESLGKIAMSEKERPQRPAQRESKVEVVVPPQTPTARYSSPTPSGRKWARKLD